VCGGGVTNSGVACLQDLSQLRSLSLAQVILSPAAAVIHDTASKAARPDCRAHQSFAKVCRTWHGLPAWVILVQGVKQQPVRSLVLTSNAQGRIGCLLRLIKDLDSLNVHCKQAEQLPKGIMT
jgi:hypothetical protein